MLSRLKDAIDALIWHNGGQHARRIRRFFTWWARIAVMITRDLVQGDLTLRAMSLVYTTLLSLVPLLAFSFSILKAFGVHNRIEPLVYGFLEPLGPSGREIGDTLMKFVDNVKAGVLGSIGLALLVYTIISLVQKVEAGFNRIWHVKTPRTVTQRFSDYLSVILVGPLLVVSAFGITATIANHSVVQHLVSMAPFGKLVVLTAKLVPYLLVVTAFTFINIFVPNCRVRFRSALVGGILGGVSWEWAGWAFARLTATSTQYTAIYSGFAILIFFMLWIYLSWVILLVGTDIAFYHQNPQYIRRRRVSGPVLTRTREQLALLLMYLIGHNYLKNGKPRSLEELAHRTHAPVDTVADVIQQLEQANIVLHSDSPRSGYVLARDADAIRAVDIIAAIRSTTVKSGYQPHELAPVPAVTRVMNALEESIQRELGQQTLRQLIESSDEET